MRISATLLFAAAPVLLAASAPVTPSVPAVDAALAQARVEARAAAKRLQALEDRAARARSEADRLAARQIAAAAAIDEAEARISESDAKHRLAKAQAAQVEQRLAARRAPLAALLAGLAVMGRQPPLLTLADQGSVDELVRVKALLDATLPVIEARSAALKAELSVKRRLASAANRARAEMVEGRDELARRRHRFAELEAEAVERANRLTGEALGAGDRVLASSEDLSTASADTADRRTTLRNAAEVAILGLTPARPMRGDSALAAPDFAYSLPVAAPLADGLGSVSRAGIVSRGLRFDTARGTAVIAPADGRVAFAAPFRGQDGLVIIEHGSGWISLLLNVASEKPKGTQVNRGEFLGRALGPVGVELRRNGKPVSPALIAASSQPLSNGGDTR